MSELCWTSERRPIAQLTPAPYNPREMTELQARDLSRSLERFSLADPIVINRNNQIIGGHQRIAILKTQGVTEVDVRVPSRQLTETEERELNLRLNKNLGQWDFDHLANFDEELLRQVGFEGSELDKIFQLQTSDADAGLPLPEVAVSRRGELYELGRHRLLCGDSTKAEDVARLLDGHVPFLCVTDPPYGVNYDPQWRSEAASNGHLAYAASRVGRVANDDRADWRETWALFPGDVIYSWHPAGATSLVHAAALQDSGFALRMQIIWAKSNFPISRGDYHVRHEPCWYAVRKGKVSHRTDDRTQTTLWEINLDKNVEGGHSTQKPLECMERPIRNHYASEIYDPFCGSGTTLIASERLRRQCYAMEIEPRYCDVIRDRYARFVGEPKWAAHPKQVELVHA